MSGRRAAWVAAGLTGAVTGIVLGIISLEDLFRYSPYGDPADLGRGLWLGVAAVVLIFTVPVTSFALFVIRGMREYAAWKRTLTPAQRAELAIAEAAVMGAAHIAWRDHNRAMSTRLTASVMGDERGAPE